MWVRIVVATAAASILAASVAAQSAPAETADVLMQRAAHKQMVEGSLEEAIALYGQVARAQGANRAVVAKALVQIGRCYEKLGKDEAKKAYESVVRDYGDQTAEVSEARERLALLRTATTPRAETLATRRIWLSSGTDTPSLGAPSPDGRYVTAVDWMTGNLIARDLATNESRALTGKEGWDSQEFALFSLPSPDGNRVAYGWFRDNWKFDLRVIRLDGGGARSLIEGAYVQPMAWTPDGAGILTLLWKEEKGPATAALVSAADASMREVATFDKGTPIRMTFSPDGKFVAYDLAAGDPLVRDIFVIALESSERLALVEGPGNDSAPLWDPDGREVFFISDRGGSNGLWSVPVANGRATGEPRLIKAAVGRVLPTGITRDGRLFYAAEASSNDIYEVRYEAAAGKVAGTPRRAVDRYIGENSSPVWAPDGKSFCYLSKRAAALVGAGNYAPALVVRAADGSERFYEPEDLSSFGRPAWTPDGKSILVIGRRRDGGGLGGVYSIDLDSGKATPLIVDSVEDSPVIGVAISRDRTTLYLARQLTREKAFGVFRRDLATGKEILLHQPQEQGRCGYRLALSSDGSLLATWVWWLKGNPRAAVRLIPTAPGGATRDPAGEQKGTAPGIASGAVAFSADGKELFFAREVDPGKDDVDLWRVPVAGGEASPVGLAADRLRELSVSPDGGRFLFTAGRSLEELWVLENSGDRASSKP